MKGVQTRTLDLTLTPNPNPNPNPNPPLTLTRSSTKALSARMAGSEPHTAGTTPVCTLLGQS